MKSDEFSGRNILCIPAPGPCPVHPPCSTLMSDCRGWYVLGLSCAQTCVIATTRLQR